MEFRFLGNSGLKVSAVSYGNWVTHTEGRAEQATACVRAALEAAHHDVRHRGHIWERSRRDDFGRCAIGRAPREPRDPHQVFGATGGPNDSGLSRKHIHESINASLTRLQTDYVDLYPAMPCRGLWVQIWPKFGALRCRAPSRPAPHRRRPPLHPT